MSVVPMALICGEWPNPVGMAEIVTRDFNPGHCGNVVCCTME